MADAWNLQLQWPKRRELSWWKDPELIVTAFEKGIALRRLGRTSPRRRGSPVRDRRRRAPARTSRWLEGRADERLPSRRAAVAVLPNHPSSARGCSCGPARATRTWARAPGMDVDARRPPDAVHLRPRRRSEAARQWPGVGDGRPKGSRASRTTAARQVGRLLQGDRRGASRILEERQVSGEGDRASQAGPREHRSPVDSPSSGLGLPRAVAPFKTKGAGLMPATQRGSVYATARGFGIQWRDDNGADAAARASRQSEARAGSATSSANGCAARPSPGPRHAREHVDALPRAARGRPATRTRSASLRERLASRRPRLRRRPSSATSSGWPPRSPRGGRRCPNGSRYGIMQAFRQTLEAAVRWGDIDPQPGEARRAEPAAAAARGRDVHARRGRQDRRRARRRLRPDDPLRRRNRAAARGVDRARAPGRRPRGRRRPRRADARRGPDEAVRQDVGSAREVPLSARALAALDACRRGSTRGLCSPGPRGRPHQPPQLPPPRVAARARGGRRPPRGSTTSARRSRRRRSRPASPCSSSPAIMGTSVRMIERHYGRSCRAPATRSAGSSTPTSMVWAKIGPRNPTVLTAPRTAKPAVSSGFREWAVLGSNQ